MILPSTYRPSRILVIRPRGLGDIVLATVVLDALRRAWPGAAIDYLAERPSRQLLETDPRLDRIFLIGPPGEGGDRIAGGGTMEALRWIRRGRPDLVLDLFSNPRTALLTGLSGAAFRAGLDKRPRRLAYNVRVPRFRGPADRDHRYAQDFYLDFLRAAGIRWEGEARASVPLRPEDRAFATRALAELGYPVPSRFGALLPGGSWESKRWSVAGFVTVGRVLREELGQPVLVLWGPPERGDAEAIAGALGEGGRLAPPTTLREMAALLARASLLVSPDCLGRHLAVVQGLPTVGVFGSTDPRHWTPTEGIHRTIRGGPEQGLASLRDLPPDPVIAAVRELLTEGKLDSAEPPA